MVTDGNGLTRGNPTTRHKFIIHHAATYAGRVIETEVQRPSGNLVAAPHDRKPAWYMYVQICNSEFDHVSSYTGATFESWWV